MLDSLFNVSYTTVKTSLCPLNSFSYYHEKSLKHVLEKTHFLCMNLVVCHCPRCVHCTFCELLFCGKKNKTKQMNAALCVQFLFIITPSETANNYDPVRPLKVMQHLSMC